MPTGSVLEQESWSLPPTENGKQWRPSRENEGSGVKSEEEAAPTVKEGNWLR